MNMMKKQWIKDLIKSQFAEKLIGGFAFYYLKFVGLTTRWKSVTGVKETYDALKQYGSIIVIGWHGRTLMMPYYWDKRSKLKWARVGGLKDPEDTTSFFMSSL